MSYRLVSYCIICHITSYHIASRCIVSYRVLVQTKHEHIKRVSLNKPHLSSVLVNKLGFVPYLQLNESVTPADVDAVRLTVGHDAVIQADNERLLQAAQVVANLQRT